MKLTICLDLTMRQSFEKMIYRNASEIWLSNNSIRICFGFYVNQLEFFMIVLHVNG